MDFKFGRAYDDSGQRCVKVNGRIFYINEDGTLETSDMYTASEMDERYNSISIERLNEWVTNAYKSISSLRRMKKKAKEVNVPANHWYRVLPHDKKVELIERVAEQIENILTDQLLGSPTNKLNDYYRTLQDRVRYTKISLPPELPPCDLAKLPTYDASTDKLYGNPVQYLKLISIAYPSGRRKQKFLRVI